MRKHYNCPNCGAPIEFDKCDYCGTRVIDMACIETDKPFYIKVRKGEHIFIANVILNNALINVDVTPLWGDNACAFSARNDTLSMDFSILEPLIEDYT